MQMCCRCYMLPKILVWAYHRWKPDEILRHMSDDQLNLKFADLVASYHKRQKIWLKKHRLLFKQTQQFFPKRVQMATTVIMSEVIILSKVMAVFQFIDTVIPATEHFFFMWNTCMHLKFKKVHMDPPLSRRNDLPVLCECVFMVNEQSEFFCSLLEKSEYERPGPARSGLAHPAHDHVLGRLISPRLWIRFPYGLHRG